MCECHMSDFDAVIYYYITPIQLGFYLYKRNCLHILYGPDGGNLETALIYYVEYYLNKQSYLLSNIVYNAYPLSPSVLRHNPGGA